MELSFTEYKGVKITCDPKTPAMKVIRPLGKGSVDTALRGLYTGIQQAKEHIDLIESRKKANANKKKSTDGDVPVLKGTDNGSKPAKLSA